MYEVNIVSFLWRFSSESRSGLAGTLHQRLYQAFKTAQALASCLESKVDRPLDMVGLSLVACRAVTQNGKLSCYSASFLARRCDANPYYS